MKPKELTIRGLILGALITTVFTAANVYLVSRSASPSPRRSRGGDLDGDPERGEGLDDPREQHRPDRRLGGRHALAIIFRFCLGS